MSDKIGRRSFMKKASSALLGITGASLLGVDGSSAGSSQSSPEYRTLGKTGLKVTAVSMGVMNCSDPSVVLRAYDMGVNFFDTARRYMGGKNEEMVGKALKGKRDKVYIQTKVRLGATEKENRDSVETSLKALQTDYVDVLLVHALKTPEEVCDPGILDFLSAMKKEGKARFTGFSSHTDMAALLRAAAQGKCHDVALVSYNYTHSDDLKEAVALAAQAGTGVIAMKTQAGGYKTGNMAGLSPHQAALKYVLNDRNIATAIPGVTTIEQIEECVGVMGKPLAGKDLDTLRKYDSQILGRICTMCDGCIGECPFGLDHTDFMRVVMYHHAYGDNRLAKQVVQEEKLANALKFCSDCSSCSISCRRGLNIRAQIEWVKRVLV